MKILFLTQTYPRFESDTAGPFIRAIARGLAATGDEIHVLAPWHPRIDVDNVNSQGITFHHYRYAPSSNLCLLGYSQSMQADVKLRGAAYLLGPLMFVAAKRKLVKLLKSHRFDCLNVHWLIPNGVIAASPARRMGIPLVMSLHGSGIFMAESNRVYAWLARKSLAPIDAVTSCSPDFLERDIFAGLNPGTIKQTIPYGVNVDRFTPAPTDQKKKLRDELGLLQDRTIIFAVGRMVYKKGFEFLLRATHLIKENVADQSIVLGGDGDLMDDLKGLASSLGIAEKVVWPGLIYRESLPKFYQAADIFAMPSVMDQRGNVDGLPNVVLESMASGLPVIASRISGLPLAVEDGRNGRLVKPADPESLAAAMKELLASDELRQRFGAESRKRTEEELNWNHVARQYRAVYEQAIGKHR
ncbi:glycosyltransferase family 4 protein [Acidobacteriota bacterium]